LGKAGGQRIYVIQEHHASHLHWDLRLEMNGALRSWAVPKTPPEAVGVRRLAVEVEDHPMEYALFEGEIPEGEYGAGLVTLWDRGTYDAVKVTENKIVFTIRGERLKGNYCLLRTRFGGVAKNWLFFKMKS
jgi:DNA ligase D-like protein (predicted 3'-phosphoesterase)